MTVEELKVILELETKGFNKQAESAKRSLNDTEKAATSLKDKLKKIFGGTFAGLSTEANKAKSSMANSMSGIAKESEKVNSSLGKVRSIMRDLKISAFGGRLSSGLIDATAEAKSYMQELVGCEQAVSQLNEILKDCDPGSKEYAEGSQKVSEYTARINELTQKLESMPNFGTHGLFQDTGPISNIKTLKAQMGGLRDYVSGIRSGFTEVFQVTPVGRFATRVGSAFTGIKRFIIGAKNDIGTFGKKILDVGKHFGIFGRRAGNAGSSVKNFIKSALGIGSLVVLFNKLKSAASEGFNNLSQYSGRTSSDLAMLRGSLTQVKNSLATAFAPILTVIAPIIQTFVNLITTACNALAMFFGALTGQKTVTVAKAGLGDIAAGAGSAADATGAANGAAEEYQRTLMGFDQINKLDDTSGSGGGSGGGGGVGGGAGFSTAEISTAASGWAERVKEAWRNADFTDIGSIIASKINSAMDSINWTSIKEKCNKVAKSIGTFINGFVATLDWGQVGYTLSQGLITAVDMISTFLQTVDWAQIGRSVIQFIAGIDWKGLFASAAGLLGSIAGGFAALIGGAISEAWAGVKAYFMPYLNKDGVSIVDGIFWGIVDGIKGIASWIKKNIFDPFTKGFKKAFGISSPSKEMKKLGGYLIDGLLQGLKNNKITKFFSGLVKDLGKFFKNPVGSIKIAIDKSVDKAKTLYDSFKNSTVVKTLTSSLTSAWNNAYGQYHSVYSRDVKKTLYGGVDSSFTNTKVLYDNVYSKEVKINVKGHLDSEAQKAYSVMGAGTGTWNMTITRGYAAGGGLYSNGSWKPVTQFAGGGVPNAGQMFVAREAGPELVGTIGGHTAVMNNDQIVSSVAAGVARAVASVMGSIGGQTAVVLEGDAQNLFRVIRTEARNYVNATGRSPFPV